MKVRSAFDADVTVATYAFFADDRRASRLVTNRGGLNGVTYYFYDGHEVIEERDGSGAVVQQYLFGPQHIDELLLTLGENGANWVHQDANWNIIGTTTSTGQVAERYTYDPYGRLRARRLTGFGDTDADGLVGSKDIADWEDTQGEGGVYDRKLDANLDGVNDAYDAAAFDKMVSLPGGRLTVPNRRMSPSEQWAGYTARTLDPEAGLMHYRLRAYSPELRRFGQRDPIGYVDGGSLYEYVGGNPATRRDPLGLTYAGGDRVWHHEIPWDVEDVVEGVVSIHDKKYGRMMDAEVHRKKKLFHDPYNADWRAWANRFRGRRVKPTLQEVETMIDQMRSKYAKLYALANAKPATSDYPQWAIDLRAKNRAKARAARAALKAGAESAMGLAFDSILQYVTAMEVALPEFEKLIDLVNRGASPDEAYYTAMRLRDLLIDEAGAHPGLNFDLLWTNTIEPAMGAAYARRRASEGANGGFDGSYSQVAAPQWLTASPCWSFDFVDYGQLSGASGASDGGDGADPHWLYWVFTPDPLMHQP